jgi:GAF domain-containing protein
MSSLFTPEQEAHLREITAGMIGSALRGSDERLRRHLPGSTAAADACAVPSCKPLTPEQEANVREIAIEVACAVTRAQAQQAANRELDRFRVSLSEAREFLSVPVPEHLR